MWKVLKYILILLISLPVLAFLYLDSDFFEGSRLREQIDKNLKLSLSSKPRIIDRENYGWAEEGRDKSLLKLSSQDCLAVESKLENKEKSNKQSEYYEMFKKNHLVPKTVKILIQRNSHGDFTVYALDIDSCSLYRQYHYE